MKIYPNSLELGRCKDCGVRIAWLLTFPNQRKVPLDLPIKSDTIESDSDGHQVETLRSRTHFDTCPARNKSEPKPKPVVKSQGSLF